MGRDHTIYAKEKGYVVYYKDPEQLSLGVGAAGYGGAGGTVGKKKVREGRKYIGVVLEREDRLPRPRGTVRRRRLGMEVRVIEERTAVAEAQALINERVAEQDQTTPTQQPNKERKKAPAQKEMLPLRPGYMYRLGNWQIGRAAERTKRKVRIYQKGDRFLAWRKRTVRRARATESRSLRSKGKTKPRGGR